MVKDGFLGGFDVCTGSSKPLSVFHLLYADNITIFWAADLDQFGYLRGVHFSSEAISGLPANLPKSELNQLVWLYKQTLRLPSW